MKVLYRKYRPTKLSEVVGQPQVTDVLAKSLESGKLAHAYLFIGPRGCGKTSVARIFAHEVNDFPYEIEDNYVDIIEIDAASNTGVENIRELKERAVIAPTKGKYKVYIIDEVHMLSKSAFNALLKILEEPPKHVIFIMATTEADKVLDTIVSRSQVYRFRLADQKTMLDFLNTVVKAEKLDIDDSALEIIARRGSGSFRDTLSILDQISSLKTGAKITTDDVTSALGLPKEDAIADLLSAYTAGDLTAISDQLKNLLNSGIKPEALANEVIVNILRSPKPEHLALLKRLPDVSAPFSEAKLLLAFTADLAQLPTPKPATRNAPAMGPAAADPPTGALEMRAPVGDPPAASPIAGPVAATVFTWESYLAAVKPLSAGVYTSLLDSDYELGKTTLRIIPHKPFRKKILESPSNSEILKANLPQNFSLEIIDPIARNAEKIKKDPTLSQISDIMGTNIQEVNDDGNSPF